MGIFSSGPLLSCCSQQGRDGGNCFALEQAAADHRFSGKAERSQGKVMPLLFARGPSSLQSELVAKSQSSADLKTAEAALLKAFEVVAEQRWFKPTICWNYCVLLKQEGGSSLTAVPGPTSLRSTSLCIQQHSLAFGFASEKMGIITQITMLHAAFPESLLLHGKGQPSGNCGSCSERQEQRALPLLSSSAWPSICVPTVLLKQFLWSSYCTPVLYPHLLEDFY